MKNEKKYTITLNEHQLFTLEHMTDVCSRLICGQLDMSVQEYAEFAWEKEHKSEEHPHGCGGREWSDMRNRLEELLAEIKSLCWNQRGGEYHGIHYDDTADELIDIHQVLRKFRHDYIMSDEDRELLKFTVMGDPPRHYSEQPLIEVKEA